MDRLQGRPSLLPCIWCNSSCFWGFTEDQETVGWAPDGSRRNELMMLGSLLSRLLAAGRHNS